MNEHRLEELLQGTARREEEAFSLLYREFFPVVKGIARTVLPTGEDSADAAQEVFALLWALPPERFPTRNPGAWLYTVTKRRAWELLKKQRPALPLEDLPPLPSPGPGPESALDEEAFRELTAPLDPVSRQIVTLKLQAGFTHGEIAKLLGLNPATVRWKYAKAVHTLRLFWGNLLGAVAAVLAAVWAFPRPEITAGGPSEGGVDAGPELGVLPETDWFPWALLPLLAALLALVAGYFGWKLWKKRKK